MNQWPNGSTSAMFPQNTPGHMNPAAMYNNLGGGGTPGHFDINQYSQGLQNGHSASPAPGFPTPQQQQPPQQQPQQTFQPGSVIPAKRPHDGMSGSPVQPQGSRSQTPSFAGFPTPQPGAQQFSSAPTPFQHLQQTNSANATPSPTMSNQQFRPPTQPPSQQQPQAPTSRMQNASPNPYSQPPNYGNQMSPVGGPHGQNPGMNMMQQGQMGGFNPQQFGMNNMSMGGMPSSMTAQMNSGMPGQMPGNPQQQQQVYQARLMQQSQAMRARGMVPPGTMGVQQAQQQQQQQQQQQPQPQNQMYNPAAQQQMGGQMPNGQMGGGMNLNQQKMQQHQQQQQQKRQQFLKTLATHAQQQGRSVNLNPTIGGRPVDLYVLWWLITNNFGGSPTVEKTQQWPAVAAKLGFPPNQYPTAADELKQLYAGTIAQYERLWFAMQSQRKQEARMQASQMAGMGPAPVQASPTRQMQPPNPQNPYAQFQQGQPGQQQQPPQPQPHATPVAANAQLPRNGMSTPQHAMMQPRRESSARKPEQISPMNAAAPPAPPAMSPQIGVKPVGAPSLSEQQSLGPALKSEEPQSTNYVPQVRSIEADGGYDTHALFELGTAISRAIPNMPSLEEMGVIDMKAITLSLASGIHGEVRYALDALALVTNDPRIKPELAKCEDLLDVIVDCAEDQIEILSEDAVEVSDGVDLLSYEDVMRHGRIEAEALQDVPEFGSRAYDLERAADRLIAITTIMRNFSFFEENHHLLTSDTLIKWLSNTIRLIGTRNMLLRTYHNLQDFYKDMITFLSNITQSLELPARDDALHVLHFLLAFAPQPAPAYTASNGHVRFVSFGPAIHKYLPPAVDCLAKLLARQDPNRTFYKSIFTSSSSSTANNATLSANNTTNNTSSESPQDLLTRAFALAISVLPDRSTKGPLTNSQQLRIVEARKAYLTQGMLAADILTTLAPASDNELARAWLESEDGWAVGLLRLVSLLSVAPPPPQHPPPQEGGGRSKQREREAQQQQLMQMGFDAETSRLITWRALSMLKRLAEKAARCTSSSSGHSGLSNGSSGAATRSGTASVRAPAVGGGESSLNGVGVGGVDGAADESDHVLPDAPDGPEEEVAETQLRRLKSRVAAAAAVDGQRNDEDGMEFFRGPKWESMPQGHAIVGALVMASTDKVALGLLCGLHEMAMLDSEEGGSSSGYGFGGD